jgi:hypothetical protein
MEEPVEGLYPRSEKHKGDEPRRSHSRNLKIRIARGVNYKEDLDRRAVSREHQANKIHDTNKALVILDPKIHRSVTKHIDEHGEKDRNDDELRNDR